MRLLFRTRPYCLDGLSVGELPATRDSLVVSLYHPHPFANSVGG